MSLECETTTIRRIKITRINFPYFDQPFSKLIFKTVDAPVGPSEQGIGIWKNKMTVEQLDEKRSQYLSVTKADLLRVAEKYLVRPSHQSDTIIGPTEALIRQDDENPAAEFTEGWKLLKL
jgi:Zn-dependent M16 (insulinase) family peptidase